METVQAFAAFEVIDPKAAVGLEDPGKFPQGFGNIGKMGKHTRTNDKVEPIVWTLNMQDRFLGKVCLSGEISVLGEAEHFGG